MGATNLAARIYNTALTQYRSWIHYAIATNLCSVGNYRTKFLSSCLYWFVRRSHSDLPFIQTDIRNYGTRTQMTTVAKNGISHIVKVRDHDFVHQNAVFQFCYVSNNTIISSNNISSNVSTCTNLTVFADQCWSLDNCPMFDGASLPDDNTFLDMDLSDDFDTGMDTLPLKLLEIWLNLVECSPNRICEQISMFVNAQLKILTSPKLLH